MIFPERAAYRPLLAGCILATSLCSTSGFAQSQASYTVAVSSVSSDSDFKAHLKNDLRKGANSKDGVKISFTSDRAVIPEGKAEIWGALFDCSRPADIFVVARISKEGSDYSSYFDAQFADNRWLSDQRTERAFPKAKLQSDGLCFGLMRGTGGVGIKSAADLLRSNKFNISKQIGMFR
jgi:hypothetical protein